MESINTVKLAFFFVRFLLLLRTAYFLFSVYSFIGFLIPNSSNRSLGSKLCPCHSCTSSEFPILPWNLMLLLIISSVSATALYSPTFTSFLSAEKQTRAIVYGSSHVLNYLTDFACFLTVCQNEEKYA